jgi:hypothetical protein
VSERRTVAQLNYTVCSVCRQRGQTVEGLWDLGQSQYVAVRICEDCRQRGVRV